MEYSNIKRKANQLAAIDKNIHIVEGLRNKHGYSFSEMVYALDLITQELEQIYNRYYPNVIEKTVVNTRKNQRQFFIYSLLKDTTIDNETISHIVGITGLFPYCIKHNLWPSSRKHKGNANSEPIKKKVDLIGNKREIKIIIGKIKRIMDSMLEIDPDFDRISYIETHITNENNFHLKNKQGISNIIANLIMSNFSEDFNKIKDYIGDLKIENERHQYAVNELLNLSNNELEKQFENEFPEEIENSLSQTEKGKLFAIPFSNGCNV